MKELIVIFPVLLALSIPLSGAEKSAASNWPGWRGPEATGASVSGTPPVAWSETENIRWKTSLPGKGYSTPVIWGNRIFVTSAVELDKKAAAKAIKRMKKSSPAVYRLFQRYQTTEHFLKFVVYCVNKETGDIFWRKTVREQYPHEDTHVDNSWASASCVTDGEHIIASFGSFGIYCLDMEGNIAWEKDPGDMRIDRTVGESISPVLHENSLVIVWDHEDQSKIFVFDKRTGGEIWQKNRDEVSTWATPIIVELKKQAQIISPGKTSSRAYDLKNGNIIWTLGGLGDAIIPSPVSDGKTVFLMTGDMSSKNIQAVNLATARGNIGKGRSVAWSHKKNPPYVSSPLLYNNRLYYVKGTGPRISCADAATGKMIYGAVKMEGIRDIYASPVYANGHIYVIDRRGTCAVIREGVKFRAVASNKLDDRFDASPAVSGNDMILRGHRYLFCISE